MLPRRTFRLLALFSMVLAATQAHAEDVPPNIFSASLSNCNGNFAQNPTSISTAIVNARFELQDTGTGLRFERAPIVGGLSAKTNTIVLAHFDSPSIFVDSTTFNHTIANGGTAACGANEDPFSAPVPDGGCRSYTANGQNVFIARSPQTASTTAQFTLQAWVFPTDTSSDRPIFEFSNSLSSGVFLHHSVNSAGDLFAAFIDTFGAVRVASTPAGGFLQTNQWQLVTLTWSGTVATIFVDTAPVASASLGTIPQLAVGEDFWLGHDPVSNASFRGRIDEFRMMRSVLSPIEIENDFHSGKVEISTSTVGGSPSFTLLTTGDYAPSATNGQTVFTTATVSNLFFGPGSGKFIDFITSDLAGNARRIALTFSVDESPPTTPLIETPAAVSTSQIDFTWGVPNRLCNRESLGAGTPGAYDVLRASDNFALSSAQTGTTFSDTGHGPNTLRSVRLRALDDFGTSPLTSAVTAYTFADPPTGTAASSISTGSAIISWNSTNPNFTRFEMSLSLDNFATVLSTPVGLVNNLTATTTGLTGLLPQTTYYVRVRAFNQRLGEPGISTPTAFSNTSFITLPDGDALNLGGFALGISSIRWTWNALPSALTYTLEEVTGPTTLTTTAALSFDDTGLPTNQVRRVRLRANNVTGSGPFGPTVSRFTLAEAPTGTTLVATTSSTVQISWNVLSNPVSTLFEAQIATSTSFGTITNSILATGNNATFSGLLPGTTYALRVRARNGDNINTAFDVAVTTETNLFGGITSTDTPASPYVPPANTVANWHFDEGGGTFTADASGFGHHGSLVCELPGCSSTPTFTGGMSGLGFAVAFTGLQDSLIRVTTTAALNTTGDLSVEALVNPLSLSQVDGAGIVTKSTGANETFALDIDAAKRYRFAIRSSTGGYFSARSSVTIGFGADVWQHVVGVFDSAVPSLSIYLNGELSGTTALPGGVTTRYSTDEIVGIGNRMTGTSRFDRGYSGNIDEVNILTRALNATEVEEKFNAVSPSTATLPAPNDDIQIEIPPDSFRQEARILVSGDPQNGPIVISAQLLNDGLASPPTGQTLVPGSVVEIIAQNKANGLQITDNFFSSVTLSIPYPDTDNNLIIDGTDPPVSAQNLTMYTLNTTVLRWEALPSSVDLDSKRVSGKTGHFSIFALFGPAIIQPNVNQVFVYPVPWLPGSTGKFGDATFGGESGLAFSNLAASGNIRIFTMSGERVVDRTFSPVNVGTFIWDGKNHAGRDVASGIYFAYVESVDGSKQVLKFAIER